MKKIAILVLYVFQTFIISNVNGQNRENYIVFHKPYKVNLETNHYTTDKIRFDYNTQYLNLKTANVENDLMIAMKHNDYRFIAISGNSYLWPGLMGYIKYRGGKAFGVLKQYEKYIAKDNYKVIMGTSDELDESQLDLQGEAFKYAEKYNKLLLEKQGYIAAKHH